jgi:hypothetical protein
MRSFDAMGFRGEGAEEGGLVVVACLFSLTLFCLETKRKTRENPTSENSAFSTDRLTFLPPTLSGLTNELDTGM